MPVTSQVEAFREGGWDEAESRTEEGLDGGPVRRAGRCRRSEREHGRRQRAFAGGEQQHIDDNEHDYHHYNDHDNDNDYSAKDHDLPPRAREERRSEARYDPDQP